MAARLSSILLFLAAGWLAIAVGLTTAGGRLGALPAPDLLFCVTALWVVRRPAAAPVAAIFALGLARDLVGGGPPGLGALALLLVSEAMRAQGPALRRGALALEWAAACGWCAAALALQWLLLGLTFAPAPSALELLGTLAATAAALPAAALVLRWPLRAMPRDARGEPSPFGLRS